MLKEILKALLIYVIQQILPRLMTAAEQKFGKAGPGEDKKAWVLKQISAIVRSVSPEIVGALLEGNMPEVWAARETSASTEAEKK